ncbi:MAG: hypothetical protein QXL47_00645 [Candidatus Anstonellales archaeon]
MRRIKHGSSKKEEISKQLRTLQSRWKDLIEKMTKRNVPIPARERANDVLNQLEAFTSMFKELAYGDRSKYGENKLTEFKNITQTLLNSLRSIKTNITKKNKKLTAFFLGSVRLKSEPGPDIVATVERLTGVTHMEIMNSWLLLRDTADKITDKIKEAVAIIHKI